MAKRLTEAERVQRLVDELFNTVEAAQGYFFVSDGETFPTAEELFDRTRGRLEWGKEAVARMEDFLRKYGAIPLRSES